MVVDVGERSDAVGVAGDDGCLAMRLAERVEPGVGLRKEPEAGKTKR